MTTTPAEPTKASSSRRPILVLLGLVILVALGWWLHSRVPFDWYSLGHQLRSIDYRYALTGVALIYFSFWLRAVRWSILLAPVRKVPATKLIASQLIGFTAVALIGRIADLSRPYLIARRLRLPVASQLAIYSVERAFDLGAAAILFSVTLAFAPHDLPHHEAYFRAGALSLAATLGIAIFAVSLRLAGELVARIIRTVISPLSANFANTVADRMLDFREGLRTISSWQEFLSALMISLIMWGCIAITYLVCARAFVAEPTLAHLSFTAIMLVLATSLGGSLLQLPVIGWFTQIAINAAALHGFFNVPLETSTACATVILCVANLAIIPAGFLAARIEGTTLRQAVSESSVANESGAAEATPLA